MHNRKNEVAGILRFCDSFLVCTQMPVFMVFYADEQKMTTLRSVRKSRISWRRVDSINRVIHSLFRFNNALQAPSGFVGSGAFRRRCQGERRSLFE